jgi:hypothetical protein
MCRVPDHRGIASFEPALDAYPAGQGGLKQLQCFLDYGLERLLERAHPDRCG